jgi:hypothetical protein
VRVVRLMLAHGRVVVTMRHGWNGDDAVSPRNGTEGVLSRLTTRDTGRSDRRAASVVVMLARLPLSVWSKSG